MYRPCLHCSGKKYDSKECPKICTYGEDRKRLSEIEYSQKTIMLWKDDFVREKDWLAICNVLNVPASALEIEVHTIHSIAFDHVHGTSEKDTIK